MHKLRFLTSVMSLDSWKFKKSEETRRNMVHKVLGSY